MPTLLIGPLSKQPTGISLAFRIVVDYFEMRNLPHRVLDMSSTNTSRKVGTFSIWRAIEIILALIRYYYNILFCAEVYLLIGLSRVGFLKDLLIIWPASFLNRRVVLHLHSGGYLDFYSDQPTWLKRIIAATLARAHAIVVLGDLLRAQFEFLNNAEKKIQVVPNALPIQIPAGIRKSKSLKESTEIRLLYLSNLIESKGYLDCLEACNILHTHLDVPVRFTVCGGAIPHKFGSELMKAEDILRSFLNDIKRMGLDGVVEYRGVVEGKEKQEILENSHVLLLPTYYAWEGQPLCIIEALAFGCPVITTEFRGIPEEVIHGYNGFFVEPKDPHGIAKAIEKLWRKPESYVEMSKHARAHYIKHFTQEKHLKRIIPIILDK